MALGLKGASGAHKTDDAGYLAEMTDLVARLNAAVEAATASSARSAKAERQPFT